MQSEPSLDTSTLWFSNNYHSFFTIYISDVLLAHKKGERNAKELKNLNLFCENTKPLFAKIASYSRSFTDYSLTDVEF